MKIHILGSGAYPLSCADALSTCLLLPEYGVMIDAGLGISRLPQTYKTKTLSILLTHFHHDHILGLAFLANILEFGQCENVRILSDERIAKLPLFFQEPFNPSYTSQQLPVSMETISESAVVNTLQVTRKQVPHASGFSNMYKLSDGKTTCGIITDTTVTEAHGAFMKDVDVLFIECNYDNASKQRAVIEGHSYPEAISACVAIANPKKTVIIHADPRYPKRESELRKMIPNIAFAKDAEVIEV